MDVGSSLILRGGAAGTYPPRAATPTVAADAQAGANDSAVGRNPQEADLRLQQVEVRQLAARDMEVRAHEQAHAAVGGVHAGHPVYEFTKGPNGVRYAVSGHVNIDISTVPGDPVATLRKMETVARAALAPAEPSAADRSVAAKARAQAAQARAELAAEAHEQTTTALRAGESQAPGRIIDLIV